MHQHIPNLYFCTFKLNNRIHKNPSHLFLKFYSDCLGQFNDCVLSKSRLSNVRPIWTDLLEQGEQQQIIVDFIVQFSFIV